MGHYFYRAFSSDGRKEDGTIEATSDVLALTFLESQGLTVVELVLSGERANKDNRRPKRRKFPLLVQADAADQFAMLLSAGMPTLQATRTIARSSGHKGLRVAFSRIAALLGEGRRLGEAFSTVETEFEPIFGDVLRASDTSAKGAEILRLLARNLRASGRRQFAVLDAMTYPAILFAGGLTLIVFIAKVLAPELTKIFSSAGREPPMFLDAMATLGQSSMLFFGFLIFILLCGLALMRESVRNSLTQILCHIIPPLGELRATLHWARATGTLNLMQGAGFPLVAALRAASTSAGLNSVGTVLGVCADHVESGGKLRDSLAIQTSIPSMVRDLLTIGEETNTLLLVSASIAEALDEAATRKTEAILRFLPSVMTLVVGSLVGLLVYFTMDALLSLNDLGF